MGIHNSLRDMYPHSWIDLISLRCHTANVVVMSMQTDHCIHVALTTPEHFENNQINGKITIKCTTKYPTIEIKNLSTYSIFSVALQLDPCSSSRKPEPKSLITFSQRDPNNRRFLAIYAHSEISIPYSVFSYVHC